MKFKFYGVALAALAMTACNNEEILETSQQAAGSRVVFGLVSDNEGTRAQFGGTNGYTLQWTEADADKMSLFNGGILLSADAQPAASDEEAVTYSSLANAKNAIYTAGGTDENGRPVFTSHNMVYPGLAVMVYPCDTIFNYDNVEQKMYVTVPATQTKESNLLIPFVSNAINIGEFKAGSTSGAGYDRKYDIALKQAGTLFTLKTQWASENYDKIKALSDAGTIAPIELTKVELGTKDQFYFTTEAEVKITDKTPAPNKEVNDEGAEWTYVTEVVPSGRYFTNNIATEAISEDLITSEFVLLPYNKNVGINNITENNTSVVVNTSYGTVTLQKEGSVWYKNGDVDEAGNLKKYTISEGVKALLGLTYNVKSATAKSYFPGEQVGGHVARIIDCDLSDLDMSTVHIKNEKQLLDMIAVHDAIQKDTKVVFTIDGDKDGKFTMSTTTVDKLNKHEAITVKACGDEGEVCNTIVLTDATEVPAVEFFVEKTSVDVILTDGDWTWTNGKKNIKGVENLIIESRLNMKEGATIEAEVAKMINNGVVNVFGATQKIDFTNNNKLYIAKGAEYIVDNKLFINESKAADFPGEYKNCGYIKNSGVFATINKDAKIKNFGYIYNAEPTSKTFITTNQTSSVDFKSAWNGANNKFGTIELNNKDDDNYSITDIENEGFILITTNAATVTAEEIGKEANYVKVAGECTALNFTRTATENTRVLYVEIASDNEVIWTTPNTIIRGLIVPAGKKLYVKKTNKVDVSQAAYVKGSIYKGGTMTIPSFVTYFGGEGTDVANVKEY